MSLSALDAALRHLDVDQAWAICERLPHPPLNYAVRLVALLADTRDPRYDLAARRFLARVAAELEPERAPLTEIKKLVDILAHVHDGYWHRDARLGLARVVNQLDRREQRLALRFDSEAAWERTPPPLGDA